VLSARSGGFDQDPAFEAESRLGSVRVGEAVRSGWNGSQSQRGFASVSGEELGTGNVLDTSIRVDVYALYLDRCLNNSSHCTRTSTTALAALPNHPHSEMSEICITYHPVGCGMKSSENMLALIPVSYTGS
jgi:hypothetical protein